jgi:hypothetical protein
MTNLEKGAPATLIIRAVGNRTAPTVCPAQTAAEQACQPGLEPSEGFLRQSVCRSLSCLWDSWLEVRWPL